MEAFPLTVLLFLKTIWKNNLWTLSKFITTITGSQMPDSLFLNFCSYGLSQCLEFCTCGQSLSILTFITILLWLLISFFFSSGKTITYRLTMFTQKYNIWICFSDKTVHWCMFHRCISITEKYSCINYQVTSNDSFDKSSRLKHIVFPLVY